MNQVWPKKCKLNWNKNVDFVTYSHYNRIPKNKSKADQTKLE